MQHWRECLEEFGWAEKLSLRELDAIAPTGHCGDFKAGRVIFSPEASPDSVFLLRTGLVRICRVSKSGGELTLGYVGPQEVFGELSGLSGFPRESYAISVTPCRVCEMPQETFLNILDEHPAILRDVVGMISRRFKRIEGRLADLVFRDTFSRLCAILLELAEDFGRADPSGIMIGVPLTQGELATLIGSVRQTVNPLLRRLEESGYLARRGGHFILLKQHELEQIASPPA